MILCPAASLPGRARGSTRALAYVGSSHYDVLQYSPKAAFVSGPDSDALLVLGNVSLKLNLIAVGLEPYRGKRTLSEQSARQDPENEPMLDEDKVFGPKSATSPGFNNTFRCLIP